MSSIVPLSPVPSALSASSVSPMPLLPTLISLSAPSTMSFEGALVTRHKRDLSSLLLHIWQHYFCDLPHANEVQIAYCRPWKTRLGLIRMSLDNTISFIGINSLLRSPQVPECVLITTIAHELAHYAHGFGSPLPRLYEQPHANKVVENELERRGLGSLLLACDRWIDEQWYDFYAHRKTAFSRKNS